MDDWKSRLQDEHRGLTERLQKLIDFLASDAALNIPRKEFKLLDKQHKHMFRYWAVLTQRLMHHGIDREGLPALTPRINCYGQ